MSIACSPGASRKERPIPFSGPMVRAIREGRKTQTRRIVKPQPTCSLSDPFPTGHEFFPSIDDDGSLHCGTCGHGIHLTRSGASGIRNRYGVPGDRLWVKENFTFINAQREHNEICIGYDADGEHLPNRPSIIVTPEQFADFMGDERTKVDPFKRRKYPPMFMNRFFSRETLAIEDIRVQRLQDISEEDALAEGVIKLPASGRFVGAKGAQYFGAAHLTAKAAFQDIFQSIHGEQVWNANPWVWAITFQRVDAQQERAA